MKKQEIINSLEEVRVAMKGFHCKKSVEELKKQKLHIINTFIKVIQKE